MLVQHTFEMLKMHVRVDYELQGYYIYMAIGWPKAYTINTPDQYN